MELCVFARPRIRNTLSATTKVPKLMAALEAALMEREPPDPRPAIMP
jgi:hypothetical protein